MRTRITPNTDIFHGVRCTAFKIEVFHLRNCKNANKDLIVPEPVEIVEWNKYGVLPFATALRVIRKLK